MRARLACWFPGAAALLAVLVLGAGAGAETPADGAWRLTLELSSFHHGHIASFDEVVEIRNGQFDGGFTVRQTYVVLTLAIAGEAVSGRMGVNPGVGWNMGTRNFRGALAGGVFEQVVDVPAKYELYGDEGRDLDIRLVAVRMRMQRQ